MLGAAGILLILILIPLVVALFQWLWNITMPQVFNLNTVTFWQAFRLLLISSLLFKSGGGGS
jgi:succinate dehydrogenase hydrophobic anchor subunit